MSKKRHDERPARRRSRYSQLAALGLLTLGSNLGCGREMLRIPSEADGTIRGPAPIPYSATAATAAASRNPVGVGPVELREAADYGSSVNELFLASYRDSSTYGPHLAKFNSSVKSHGEKPAEGSLIATNDAARPQSPGQSQPDASDPSSRLSAPPAYARQRYRDPVDSPYQPTQTSPSRLYSQNLRDQAQNRTPAPAPAPAAAPPAAEQQTGLSSASARPEAETEAKATSSSQPAGSENQVSIPPPRRVDTPSEPASAVDIPMPAEPVKQTSATAEPAAEPAQADATPALPDLTVAPPAPVVEEVPTPKAEAPATEASSPGIEAETPAAEVPTPAAEAPAAEVPTPTAEPAESLLPPAAAMEAPAEPPSEPAAPVELPAPQPPATDAKAELEATANTPELPSQEQAPATTPELPMPNQAPATTSELPVPNQAPATTPELPVPNQAPATATDVPMPNQAPATPSLDDMELPELPMPNQAPATPNQESATLPELPGQEQAPATAPELPNLEQAPATAPELPMPNLPPATTPELPMPNQESATATDLPMPNLAPATPGPQDALELPELPAAPTDLPLPKDAKQSQSQPQLGNSAEAAKREQPGETFKLASIPQPTPAVERSKPEGGAAAQPGADSGSAPPLPPLQVDPSVFDAAIELPPTPPQPLTAPAPTATATAECPACMVLKKQKASDRWSNGQQANQTVLCPKCEENQARSKTKAAAKIKTKAVALDATL